MPGVLFIPMNLNKIQFKNNCLKMIVENNLQSFKDMYERKRTVGSPKSLIKFLIYNERKLCSLSKQDSSKLLINLDWLDFSYEYDNLFQKTLSFKVNNIKRGINKVNPDLLSNINDTKNSDDSVNSNQNWNYTYDKFTGYGGIELQRRCDEIKMNFKLNYDFNTSKKIEKNRLMFSWLQIKYITR